MTHSLMGLVTHLVTLLDEGNLSAGFSERLVRGSATGDVSVIRDAQDPSALIVVVRLEIMAVPPTDGERFFGRLLALNHRFHGRASFCVAEGMVYLTSGRPVDDLDPGELVDLILWTSEQADHYDDVLKSEFAD